MDNPESSPRLSDADYLPIGLRCWLTPADEATAKLFERKPAGDREPPWPKWRNRVLFFDTECLTDHIQKFTFGFFRLAKWYRSSGCDRLRCLREGIIINDDLVETDPDGYATMLEYLKTHKPETSGSGRRANLLLVSRTDFLKMLWWECKRQSLIVGLNLPFDFSRIADGWGEAEDDPHAFSLVLWTYRDKKTGARRPNPYRPRLIVNEVNNKLSTYRFGSFWRDQTERPGAAFLDERTLLHALTGKGHSLETGCKAFDLPDELAKQQTQTHGMINPDYIDYARGDVRSYQYLLEALRADYDKHDIDLPPEYAASPATIIKAYLRKRGVRPRLDLQPDFPPELLGQAMEAFSAGRTECHIRRQAVPVVYTDFFSMYPTVHTLLDLEELETAENLTRVDYTVDAQAMLDTLILDDVLNPETWRKLRFFARIQPDDNILPVRAKYQDSATEMWNVGANFFAVDAGCERQTFWVAGPDLAKSVLLTGKVPRILEAWTLEPHGKQDLRAVNFFGRVVIGPDQDFFQEIITQRAILKRADPKHRDVQGFKTDANSGAFGIWAEFRDTRKTGKLRIFTGAGSFTTDNQAAVEVPGPFCFPPIAALVTSGARLILGILEYLAAQRGGTYAFCDTDSMAFVANKRGGDLRLVASGRDGRAIPQTIHTLSWAEVDEIIETIDRLNPYDPNIVKDKMLKLEDVNFDQSRKQRQLYTYSVAAKRYALFTIQRKGHRANGRPIGFEIVAFKRHGLGYLVNPTDLRVRGNEPDEPERLSLEKELWGWIIGNALRLDPPEPIWLQRLAVRKVAATSPHTLRPFAKLVPDGTAYQDGMKPFNFGMEERPLRDNGLGALLAPYEKDPAKWDDLRWLSLKTGELVSVVPATFDLTQDGKETVIARSMASVASSYPAHKEVKANGPDGLPCGAITSGELSRRPVRPAYIVYLGKESEYVEDIPLLSSVDVTIHTYGPTAWEQNRQRLAAVPTNELARKTGLSKRQINRLKSGERRGKRTGSRLISTVGQTDEHKRTPADLVRAGIAALATQPPRACERDGCTNELTGRQRKYCSKRCANQARYDRRTETTDVTNDHGTAPRRLAIDFLPPEARGRSVRAAEPALSRCVIAIEICSPRKGTRDRVKTRSR